MYSGAYTRVRDEIFQLEKGATRADAEVIHAAERGPAASGIAGAEVPMRGSAGTTTQSHTPGATDYAAATRTATAKGKGSHCR